MAAIIHAYSIACSVLCEKKLAIQIGSDTMFMMHDQDQGSPRWRRCQDCEIDWRQLPRWSHFWLPPLILRTGKPRHHLEGFDQCRPKMKIDRHQSRWSNPHEKQKWLSWQEETWQQSSPKESCTARLSSLGKFECLLQYNSWFLLHTQLGQQVAQRHLCTCFLCSRPFRSQQETAKMILQTKWTTGSKAKGDTKLWQHW